jgi:hypothetical protein
MIASFAFTITTTTLPEWLVITAQPRNSYPRTVHVGPFITCQLDHSYCIPTQCYLPVIALDLSDGMFTFV